MDVDTGGAYPSIIVAANLQEAENGVRVVGSTTPQPATIALTICHAAGKSVGYPAKSSRSRLISSRLK
jgi:hypothetical protein